MKIDFKKFSKDAKEFEIEQDGYSFKGIYKKEGALYKIEAQLSGDVKVVCDMCAEEFSECLKEGLELYISDGLYRGNSEEFFDVIEQYDGFVDLDEIVKSEIASLESDYHICQKCNKS